MKDKVEDDMKEDKEAKNAPIEEEDEDYDIDYDDDSVDAGGPDVASGKGSKITLIAFSAILMAVVFYFLFFNGNEKKVNDDSDLVAQDTDFSSQSPASKSSLEDFDSIFNDQKTEDIIDDLVLDTPDIPSVPQLPDIFDDTDDDLLPAFLDLPKDSPSNEQGRGGANNNQNQDSGNLLPSLVFDPIAGQNQQNQQGQQNQQNPQLFPNTGNPQGNQESNLNNNNPQTNLGTPSSIIVVMGAAGPANSIGYENNIINLNKDPIEALEEVKPTVVSQRIGDRTTSIIQGKIITAILETAINTEFPGEVRGIVSRNVFAESGSNILIPRGSRIYGTYASNVLRGQARVTINWTRLIRPDGVDATISFTASDQFGRAGIEGDVDNKFGPIISNSILTSVLAVGGAIAAEKLSGNSSTTTTTDPTSGTSTSTGNATGQVIADVSKTIIDTVGTVVGNAIDLAPVVRVPQGTKITIVVNSDMTLPEFKK